MRWMRSRHVLGLAFAALAICEGGCEPPQYGVTGKIQYNGAILDKPEGQIVFVGPDGHQAVASIAQDGTYHATKVSRGLNRVAVYYPNPKAKKDKSTKPKPGERIAPNEPPFLTPAKYASQDTSELSITVDKETTFDVDLKGPAIR